MALDTNIVGSNVDAGGNVKAALSNTPAYIGGTRLQCENDAGALRAGVPYLKAPESSGDFRIRAGIDAIQFSDTFNASIQNTNNWAYTFVIMTASQPGVGTLNFGTVQGTATTHGAFMRTFTYFPLLVSAGVALEVVAGSFTANLVANEVFLIGFGLPVAGGTAPTDGVWFQFTSAGVIGVLRYNGVDTQTGTLIAGNLPLAELHNYCIVVNEHEVEFWKDDLFLGEIAVPLGNGQPFLQDSNPIFIQKYCTGVVSNTNTMRVASAGVTLMDVGVAKPWSHQLAGSGASGIIGQNGSAQGKTSLWGNSAAPTAVALTNIATAFTGLGGITAVLPTLAANSDGILLSYQNPTPTINNTGRNLYITGVFIRGAVSVVLAGGPVAFAYALAFGHTNVSLATAETASFATATTHAPRILPIGMEGYAVTAAAGTVGGGCQLTLNTPIVVRPGEWVAIVVRNVGVVTTTGAITISVAYDSYWE